MAKAGSSSPRNLPVDGENDRAESAFARKRSNKASLRRDRANQERMRNGTNLKPITPNATLKRALQSKSRSVRAAIRAAEARKAAAAAKIKPNTGRTKATFGTTGSAGRVRGRKPVAVAKGAGGGGKKHDGK